MPCQGGPTERDDPTAARFAVDWLTAENDQLRELILRLVNGETITKQELQRVQRGQTAHRKKDLDRLGKALRELILTGDAWIGNVHGKRFTLREAYERLGRVVMADPSEPLEPQLGFDPDSL